jgi:hypothetical protein
VAYEILEKKIPHFFGMSMKFWALRTIVPEEGRSETEKIFLNMKKKLDKKRVGVYNGDKGRL